MSISPSSKQYIIEYLYGPRGYQKWKQNNTKVVEMIKSEYNAALDKWCPKEEWRDSYHMVTILWASGILFAIDINFY